MADKRLLCVLSHVLGNRTFSDLLEERLGRFSGLRLERITLGAEDYSRYPVGRLGRLSSVIESEILLRKKVRAEGIPPHDAVLFNGIGLAGALVPLLPPRPTAVTTDTTPLLMRGQQLALSPPLPRRLLLQLSGAWQDHQLRSIRHRVSVFLPWSRWCRDSLVADYGVPPSQCHVTLTPKPLSLHRAQRVPDGPLRLIFVGNDFQRKGGDLLLDAFRTRLSQSCRLTIVSNDAALESLTLPDGVRWIRGLRSAAAVAPLYPEHDLILYPTRLDQFSNVIAEASAAGVPAITSDIGGVRDLVAHGVSGLVLPPGATASQWADAIERFVAEPGFWQSCSNAAYAFASTSLSIQAFDQMLATVVATLLPDRR